MCYLSDNRDTSKNNATQTSSFNNNSKKESVTPTYAKDRIRVNYVKEVKIDVDDGKKRKFVDNTLRGTFGNVSLKNKT